MYKPRLSYSTAINPTSALGNCMVALGGYLPQARIRSDFDDSRHGQTYAALKGCTGSVVAVDQHPVVGYTVEISLDDASLTLVRDRLGSATRLTHDSFIVNSSYVDVLDGAWRNALLKNDVGNIFAVLHSLFIGPAAIVTAA